MSSCCACFFDEIANEKFDNDMLHEFEVLEADTLNLSSNACKEINFEVPASDTLNL